ncbi:MAG: hypothetical protein HY921_12690 [Elusimicrobia bacterium]|nr:hypothetical protein [Elusimicrobiota bacterium]
MPETREFKPLKEFGSLALSENSELKFYADEFKGHQFGSIRTFLKGEGYTGPTKSGVTVNAAILSGLVESLSKLPKEPQALEEKELARFPKKIGVELVLRVTIFRDATSLDLREWVDEEGYKGWSKKGVRFSYGDLGKTLVLLQDMQKWLGANGKTRQPAHSV